MPFINVDKRVQDIFLISPQTLCCGHSLEAPVRGASNVYSQHKFY